MPTEDDYEHPELVEEEIFKHKISLLDAKVDSAEEEPEKVVFPR